MCNTTIVTNSTAVWTRDKIIARKDQFFTYSQRTTWGCALAYGGALVMHHLLKEVNGPLFFGINEDGYRHVCEIDSPIETAYGPAVEWNEGIFVFPHNAKVVNSYLIDGVRCYGKNDLLKHYVRNVTY